MTDSSLQKSEKINEKKDLFNSSDNSDNNNGPAKIKVDKKVFIFFIVVAALAVGLSFWQINKQLTSPFEKNTNKTLENSNSLAATNTVSPRIETLRDKDTDQDGLTDYDELYIYKTSPYIADSDSDKLSDQLEIEQGSDPNCPAGETCGRLVINTNASLTNTSTSQSNTLNIANLSADELRQIMRDAGASEELLSQIDDEDLLQTYQEILASEGLNKVDANANPALEEPLITSELDYNTLFNLNADGLRQLLIEGGVPEETLSEIDDATLMDIYQESLTQNASGLGSEAGSEITLDVGALDADTLLNLDAGALRQMLIEEGVDEQALNEIDDATLMDMYQQSLSEYLTGQN